MNNHVYSKINGTEYRNNGAYIVIYKSSRKNAKCEFISINHLINQSVDRKISDANILNQFIGTLEKILYILAKYDYHMEIKSYIDYFKPNQYINANGDMYHDSDPLRYALDKRVCHSFEEIINYLFLIYSLVYPYNTIKLSDIHNDSSIRYMINKFYNKAV